MNETKTDMEKLREIALEQNGFVTASQAEEIGVSRPMLTYLLKNDRIERPRRGVYRVPQVLATRFDTFRLALLWTGDKKAALSHETALDLYDVCDIVPDFIHVTVPLTRRIAKSDGDGYVIHKERLLEEDRTLAEELPVVTLVKAIEQCIVADTPSYLLEQAIKNGRDKGLISDAMARDLGRRLDERK